MARSMFPQDRLVLQRAGRSLVAAAGLRVRVTTDAAGTTPADVVALDGVTALTSLTVDDSSLLPLFLGPDGVDTLHLVRDSDGAYMGVLEAQVDPRLDDVPAMIDTALAGSRAAANTWTATQTFRPAAASGVGQIVQGVTSQTGDLQQWQNSAGTVLASLRSDGRFSTTGSIIADNSTRDEIVARLFTGKPARQVLEINGAASQTADLTQWKDSAGTVLAKVRNDGLLAAPYLRSSGDTGPFFGLTSAAILAYSESATNLPLGVRAAAAQTADLQQWQNSAGTVLAKVDASGHFYSGRARLEQSSLLLDTSGNNTDRARLVSSSGSAYIQSDGPVLFSAPFDGTARATIGTDGQYENHTVGGGLVLRSPNGTRYRVTVADTGTLTTTAI